MPPSSKHQLVQNIFDRIAMRYDLLNRVISLRFDTFWRKRAVRALRLAGKNPVVLDLGSGTGDLALAAATELDQGMIVGLDFSHPMLRLALEKKENARSGDRVFFVLGSALEPPFRAESFDAVVTAFVLRNITDLSLFFHHAYRLLRPGGKLVSLDMFPPSRFPFALFYSCYFYRLVPWIGALLAHDRDAYRYLSESVRTFHSPVMVAEILKQSGFAHITWRRFLCGAVCMHVAERPNLSGIPA